MAPKTMNILLHVFILSLIHSSCNLYVKCICCCLVIASSVLGLLHRHPDCFFHDPHHCFLLLPLLSEETMQPGLHCTEAWVWRMQHCANPCMSVSRCIYTLLSIVYFLCLSCI